MNATQHNKSDITVFLVEDDEIDVMLLERAFKNAQITNPIVHAYDGVDAMEKLNNGTVKKPFLIFLDLNMPRMNGFEFLEALRANENHKKAIVFVLTTSKAEEDKCRAYNSQIAGYLVKENVGEDFKNALSLLESFWNIVEFPE
ncbi:MAG: response regulator [Pseudobdellovibrionaceae bacterium]